MYNYNDLPQPVKDWIDQYHVSAIEFHPFAESVYWLFDDTVVAASIQNVGGELYIERNALGKHVACHKLFRAERILVCVRHFVGDKSAIIHVFQGEQHG